MGGDHRDDRGVRRHVPDHATGRAFAVILMLVGISLFGLLTANLASFLVRRDEGEPEPQRDQEIIKRLDRIEGLLDRQSPGNSGTGR